MPLCLSIRRRCTFIRTRRNRPFLVSMVLVIIGLYVLGYQSGSKSRDKEDEGRSVSLSSVQQGDLLTEERLHFDVLDYQDSREEKEDDLQPGIVSVDDVTLGDENGQTRKSTISWVSERIEPSPVHHAAIAGTKRYKTSRRITPTREYEPSTREKVSRQTSLFPTSMSDALKRRAHAHQVTEHERDKTNERNEASDTKPATKPSLDTTTHSSKSREEIPDEINVPSSFQANTSDCPRDFLDANVSWRYGQCVPHQVSPVSCQIVKQYYQLDPNSTECTNSLHTTICNVRVVDPALHQISVQCNRSVCNEHHSILVLSTNPKSGFNRVIRKFNTVEQLEKNLTEVININIQNKLYFFFLRCTLRGTRTRVSQLVPIDPVLTVRRNHSTSRDHNQININILLLDSVSRAHFYRSLPKTVQVFKMWKNNPRDFPAKVFDFELFQALEGHTAENTHALFNGQLLPPDPTKRSDARPVNPGNMFGRFSRAGYQTMWQEDLCWRGGWGLLIDLGAWRWRKLAEKAQNHSIDHTGITHSSCEILFSLGVKSPFFGPEGNKICYNGRFQHSYFLQYTLDTLRTITASPTALPLLSYMSLSVGHDHIGRRIQTLDPALVQYVNELSRNEDTLTVILSDHGNTYTSYTSTLEGNFEMFHPHLFLVIPDKVAERLGAKALDALEVNQHRLINMIDLHHTIMALTKPLDGAITPTGLFTPISAQRTCRDFELRLPNLCVCEGWGTPAANDSMKIAFVEFAVGQLNNEIEEKRTDDEQTGRSCVRLAPTHYGHVRERQDTARSSLITSMSIFIPAGDVVDQNEEVFHVEVESYLLPQQRSVKMNLLNFDRTTLYGKYAVCADRGVPLKLCICSRYKNSSKGTTRFTPRGMTLLGSKPLVKKIDECVFFVIRQHFKTPSSSIDPQSFGFELMNTCHDIAFNVSIHSSTKNIYLSRDCPFLLQLFPAKTLFFLSAMKENVHWEGSLGVAVKIQARLMVNSTHRAVTAKHIL